MTGGATAHSCWLDGSDHADVVVPHHLRLVALLAAAGGHHLGLTGDRGSGMPLVVRFLHSLLPEPDPQPVAQRADAVAAFPDLAGDAGVPWVAPHHTCSLALLLGGGSAGRPGAVTLAHGGLLHLQDVPQFPSRFLHALVPALLRREVTLARAGQIVTLPAGFQLVATAHRCGCPAAAGSCACTPAQQRRYRCRAWPLTRHLEIRADAAAVPDGSLAFPLAQQPVGELRLAVAHVRERAARRWAGLGLATNAQAGMTHLRTAGLLPSGEGRRLLEADRRCGALDTSGYVAVSRVALTIADLVGRSRPAVQDVLLARHLHSLA